jgi:hypothetical protein
MPFAERDWKHLRRVHDVALDRFCTQVLDDAMAVIQRAGMSSHERYLQLFNLLVDRNEVMATAFDDMRRSTGLQRLTAMVSLGLLTKEELAGFQPDVQDTAREMSELLAPRQTAVRARRRPS